MLPVTGESAAGGDAPTPLTPNRRPAPGHGRMSAQAYPGAQTVVYRHTTLNSGEPCPACSRGSLHAYPVSVRIRIDGSPLLTAQRHEVDNLRCSACGDVFPAVAPEDKYTEQAKAVVVYAHHELGVPLHRLSAMQANVGVPVADATLWELTEQVVGCAYPVFQHLEVLGAQSGTIFQDDTPVHIQSLLKENKTLEKGQRVGMQTTGLVCVGEHTIVLYYSGRSHAGENLEAILARRDATLPPPIQMSDALPANAVKLAQTLVCHCLSHALLKFKEIVDSFPHACQNVLHALGRVYDHDKKAKQKKLSDDERLRYHQTHSAPVLTVLFQWLEQHFANREVEPHSSLGKAMQYLLNHWHGLTQFLRIPGAPLDNNTSERALKAAIRRRKVSYFFKSTYSAQVSGVLLSIQETARQANINVVHYLTVLQQRSQAVREDPGRWLPWNYQATLRESVPATAA